MIGNIQQKRYDRKYRIGKILYEIQNRKDMIGKIEQKRYDRKYRIEKI